MFVAYTFVALAFLFIGFALVTKKYTDFTVTPFYYASIFCSLLAIVSAVVQAL